MNRYGEGLIAVVVAVIVALAVGLVLWTTQRPVTRAPASRPTPVATPTTPAPTETSVNSEALPAPCPGPDSCMGGRWTAGVTVENQVGEWFTPILQQAVAAWAAAGSPVPIQVAYDGPAACEPGEPAMGTVIVCLHAMAAPLVEPDCGVPGCPVPQAFTDVGINVTNCAEPDCPFTRGTVWISAGLSQARLLNVIIHELGHVQGIAYDPSAASVMGREARVPTITPADVQALRQLYS